MAPEIIAKKEYSGAPADVWALGVLLYTILVGNFPFIGTNIINIIILGITDGDLYKKINNGKFKVPGIIIINIKNNI